MSYSYVNNLAALKRGWDHLTQFFSIVRHSHSAISYSHFLKYFSLPLTLFSIFKYGILQDSISVFATCLFTYPCISKYFWLMYTILWEIFLNSLLFLFLSFKYNFGRKTLSTYNKFLLSCNPYFFILSISYNNRLIVFTQ